MPRYVPGRAFPPYAYLPGGALPHPTRDSRGHSHEREPEPASTAFEWGVDLYNHGYFWEAHEAWEALWRAEPAESPQRAFYEGLIQCAAACLKVGSGKDGSALRLGRRATENLERALAGGVDARGLALGELRARFAEWIAGHPHDVDTRPRIALER